jgi:hypothetical protein
MSALRASLRYEPSRWGTSDPGCSVSKLGQEPRARCHELVHAHGADSKEPRPRKSTDSTRARREGIPGTRRRRRSGGCRRPELAPFVEGAVVVHGVDVGVVQDVSIEGAHVHPAARIVVWFSSGAIRRAGASRSAWAQVRLPAPRMHQTVVRKGRFSSSVLRAP